MATHLGVVPEFLPEKHDVIPNIPPSIFKGPMGWRRNTVHDGIFGDCGGTSMGYSFFLTGTGGKWETYTRCVALKGEVEPRCRPGFRRDLGLLAPMTRALVYSIYLNMVILYPQGWYDRLDSPGLEHPPRAQYSTRPHKREGEKYY